MAYDETTKKTNAKNCAEHRWPLHHGTGQIRSLGNTHMHQCNNCLAIRVTFETDVLLDGEWKRLTEVQIVEPSF